MFEGCAFHIALVLCHLRPILVELKVLVFKESNLKERRAEFFFQGGDPNSKEELNIFLLGETLI